MLFAAPEFEILIRRYDMGLENLRQTKERMHPICMEKKYTIIER